MALPSQVERMDSNRVMTRRPGGGRGPNKKVLGVIALVVLAGGAWGIYAYLPEDATTPAAAKAEQPKKVVPAPRSLTPDIGSNVPATPTGTVAKTTSNEPPPFVITPGRDPTKPRPGDVTQSGQTPVETNTPLPTRPNPQAPAPGVPALTPPAAPGTPGGMQPTMATSGSGPRAFIDTGDAAMRANDLVGARLAYTRALMHPETAASDQAVLREKLGTINEDLLFSARVAANDPLVETYTVQSGDSLERIRKRRDLAVDHRLIARVNRLANPNAIRVGQKLKLVRGPFNVIVHKADHRLDLFAGSPDDPQGWLFIKSFRVGLGENNGTPLGTFVIKKNSKLVNPHWVNPRTGEKFDADNPNNPIGEFWLGWEGVGDSAVHTGFGLHGTIDPASIGQSKSMGCVRMGNEDIALIYELLVEQISTVRVVPS